MAPVDEVGKWSRDKLSLLKKYLNAYTTILSEQQWVTGFYYIDAFAGSGKPKLRDEEAFIDGSPRLALSLKKTFTGYFFIEREPWRVNELEKLKQEFPKAAIRILQGDCNHILVEQVLPVVQGKTKRSFVFLDPFGMDFEWVTLQKIARLKTIETLINFPLMAVNRSALPNNPYSLTSVQVDRLNRFFGSTKWRDDIYVEEPGLFGPVLRKIPQSADSLSNLFKARLAQIFPFISSPLIMTNSRGGPLYCLIFAGHKEVGRKIMENIFRRFERLGV